MSGSEESPISDDCPINKEWIIRFLQKHHDTRNGITIVEYIVQNHIYNPGNMEQNIINNLSDLLAIAIDYELNGKPMTIKIVVKLLPEEPFSRFFVTEEQFDLREIKFYTQILPDMEECQRKYLIPGSNPIVIPVPNCYYTHYVPITKPESEEGSPDPAESVLVLEDLHAKHYKSAHYIKGLSLNEAESAIRGIASVHSLSLAIKLKEKVNLNEKYPYLFKVSKAAESYQQVIEQGLPQIAKFLEKIPGREDQLRVLTALRPKSRTILEDILKPVEPMGLITHTDFWSNNLMFNEESKMPCIILDWQMITYSRPTNDIALLIISSLPSKIRRENTGKLLDLYYTTIKSNLNNFDINLEDDLGYTRAKMQEDYEKSILLAFLLCIGSVDIALGNEEAEKRFLDVLQDMYTDGVFNIPDTVSV